MSVCDHLDLLFCLVRRHGPDGYLLVVAISGSFSFLSSPFSLHLLILLISFTSTFGLLLKPLKVDAVFRLDGLSVERYHH